METVNHGSVGSTKCLDDYYSVNNNNNNIKIVIYSVYTSDYKVVQVSSYYKKLETQFYQNCRRNDL